jgi:hypothetical protein
LEKALEKLIVLAAIIDAYACSQNTPFVKRFAEPGIGEFAVYARSVPHSHGSASQPRTAGLDVSGTLEPLYLAPTARFQQPHRPKRSREMPKFNARAMRYGHCTALIESCLLDEAAIPNVLNPAICARSPVPEFPLPPRRY